MAQLNLNTLFLSDRLFGCNLRFLAGPSVALESSFGSRGRLQNVASRTFPASKRQALRVMFVDITVNLAELLTHTHTHKPRRVHKMDRIVGPNCGPQRAGQPQPIKLYFINIVWAPKMALQCLNMATIIRFAAHGLITASKWLAAALEPSMAPSSRLTFKICIPRPLGRPICTLESNFRAPKPAPIAFSPGN